MGMLAYTARDERGRLCRGALDAHDPSELREALRGRGLYLVRASASRAGARDPRVRPQELLLFTYHLQAVVGSGIPLLVGLDDLARQAREGGFRRVIEDVRDALSRGSTLAEALARHPRVFPSAYVRIVEAGEQGGGLDECLDRQVRLMEWSEELRRQVRQMVAYPIAIAFALAGLIALMIGFVLPRFRDTLVSLNVALPLPTRMLLELTRGLPVWGPILLGAAGLAGIVAIVLARSPRARERADALALRLPVIGPLLSALASSQITHFLGAFTSSGIPIGTSLEILSRLTLNRHVARRLEEIRTRLLAGDTLTRAFERAGILAPLAFRLLAIGEETGRLPESLQKAEAFYDREIPRRVKAVFDLAAPVMTVLMGAIVLFVLVAVLLPMYRMYGAIRGGP